MVNRILKLLILIVLISSSCKKEFDSIIGKYESKEYSNLELAWLGINNISASIGSTIEIKEDSTFYLQTCGNIMTGNWTLKKDTLCLFAESNRWRNDSLHLNGFGGKQPNIPKEPMKYILGRKEIINETKIKENGKTKTLINNLKLKE